MNITTAHIAHEVDVIKRILDRLLDESISRIPLTKEFKQSGVNGTCADVVIKELVSKGIIQQGFTKTGKRTLYVIGESDRESVLEVVRRIHSWSAYANKSLLRNKSDRKPILVKEPLPVGQSIEDSVVPTQKSFSPITDAAIPVFDEQEFPTLGKKYFFLHEGFIGYGLCRTIEAQFDENNSIIGLRCEFVKNGASFISDKFSSSIIRLSKSIV